VINGSPSRHAMSVDHIYAGIPVYGNLVIQNASPETADADTAFVSSFKKCIISLSKHVQTVTFLL
jgi:hypothetical protein